MTISGTSSPRAIRSTGNAAGSARPAARHLPSLRHLHQYQRPSPAEVAPAPAPVQAPSPAPASACRAGRARDRELEPATRLQALAGAGMEPDAIHQDPAAALHQAGMLLRELVAGMVVMLEARARAKSQMGAQGTGLEISGNNPLKFARSPEQALRHAAAVPAYLVQLRIAIGWRLRLVKRAPASRDRPVGYTERQGERGARHTAFTDARPSCEAAQTQLEPHRSPAKARAHVGQ